MLIPQLEWARPVPGEPGIGIRWRQPELRAGLILLTPLGASRTSVAAFRSNRGIAAHVAPRAPERPASRHHEDRSSIRDPTRRAWSHVVLARIFNDGSDEQRGKMVGALIAANALAWTWGWPSSPIGLRFLGPGSWPTLSGCATRSMRSGRR
jgi:hypothetical protein